MIFQCNTINSLQLENRIIRSATWDGLANKEGDCTEAMIRLFENLAKGGVGLIMTGFASVHPSGKVLPFMLSIDSDQCIDSLTRLTKRIHEIGGKTGIQLSHGGLYSRPTLIRGERIRVPSMPTRILRKELYQQMTKQDIQEMTLSFARAAARAKGAGFDLVQIQAGHGYLINQFLSPSANKRTDEYGGSLHNRGRFLTEIYQKMRREVGRDFPITVKLNASDMVKGGVTLEESIEIVSHLSVMGIDAIEVSGGQQEDQSNSPVRAHISHSDEGYFVPLSQQIKTRVKEIPLIIVGGIRTSTMAREILAGKSADYIAMSRPFICEADLANQWLRGNRERAQCVSCNQCFRPGLYGRGVHCALKES